MKEESEVYEGVPESPEEKSLRQWWLEQEIKSVETAESAAKQIITLCTTLLGVLVAILALTEETLPVYLDSPWVRTLSGLSIISLIFSLATAVLVVMPQQYSAHPDFPKEQRIVFRRLLKYKSSWLTRSLYLFVFGLFLLCIVTLIALFTV